MSAVGYKENAEIAYNGAGQPTSLTLIRESSGQVRRQEFPISSSDNNFFITDTSGRQVRFSRVLRLSLGDTYGEVTIIDDGIDKRIVTLSEDEAQQGATVSGSFYDITFDPDLTLLYGERRGNHPERVISRRGEILTRDGIVYPYNGPWNLIGINLYASYDRNQGFPYPKNLKALHEQSGF